MNTQEPTYEPTPTTQLDDVSAAPIGRPRRNIPTFVFKAALVVVTIIWGYSFVVMKDVVAVLPPAWLLGIRFVTAGVILALVLWKRVRRSFSSKTLMAGAILGVFDFSAFWAQTIGLEHTTPGINAFLTATYCVIVPFLWWVIAHRRPTVFNVGAALLAVVGIWLVSVTGSTEALALGFGEGMTLVSAFLFAIHIVFVSKFARLHDVLVLTVFQFLTEGLLGCLAGASFETLPPLSAITPEIVASMAFLAVFASIVAFGIQNVALAHVPPAQASLFLSLESVFGVIFSVLLYGEQVGLRLLVGFALIFVAIVISETFPLKRKSASKEDEPCPTTS